MELERLTDPAPRPPSSYFRHAHLLLSLGTLACVIFLVASLGGAVIEAGPQCRAVPRLWEPPIQGIMPGKDRPKILLATAVDYPPYSYVHSTTLDVTGFVPDFARRMSDHCPMDVVIVETAWQDCWTNDAIGAKLDGGMAGESRGKLVMGRGR